MYFYYSLFFVLNEIIKIDAATSSSKTNAAASSSQFDVAASSSKIDAAAIIDKNYELIPCPHAYFTKKLNPYNEEEANIFNAECKKVCREKTQYQGIWYINENGDKKALCWNSPKYARGFRYDEIRQVCECGIHLNSRSIPYKPCIPRMIICGIPSYDLCEDVCNKRKVHSYHSRKKKYYLGFCYVKDGYNYPNLVGKPTYTNKPKDKELKCHCAVEDLPENALSAIEERRENFWPTSDAHYFPRELRAIVDGLKTGMAINLSKVLPNLSGKPGSSSRLGEIPWTPVVGTNPGSFVSTFPMTTVRETEISARFNSESSASAQGSAPSVIHRTFLGNVPGITRNDTSGSDHPDYLITRNDTSGSDHPDYLIGAFSEDLLGGVYYVGLNAKVLPTLGSKRKNPYASSSNIFAPSTRASEENLARRNHPQLSSAHSSASTKVFRTDHVELLKCPIALFTKKLNPYNAEEEISFNRECKKACSEDPSYRGIWYINENGKKEAACWNTFRYGVAIKYDAIAQICECGVHFKARTPPQHCKPGMKIHYISSFNLCDIECKKKVFHTFNSQTWTYRLGFCYVRNSYNYPNLVGKPSFSKGIHNQELKCNCAVEDLLENALSAIEGRREYNQLCNELYSPEELRTIVEALKTGESLNLSELSSNLSESPGNPSRPVPGSFAGEIPWTSVGTNPGSRPVPGSFAGEIPWTSEGTNPGSLWRVFPILSRGEALGNSEKFDTESLETAIQESSTRIIPRLLVGTLPRNTRKCTAEKQPSDNLIGAYSQASLRGDYPGTSVEARTTDSLGRTNSHASMSTIYFPPLNASTENLARQNYSQLSSALPNTSTNAIPHYLMEPVQRRFTESGFPTLFNTRGLSGTSVRPLSDTPPRIPLGLFPSTVSSTTEIISGNNQATPIQDNSDDLDTTLSLGRIYGRKDSSNSHLSKKPRGGSK